MVRKEGFEPGRGVARRDPHLPIADGALSGSQSRAFAPPQGAPPPRTAAKDAAMSPLYYVKEVPSLTLPSPWGFNASRHQEKSRRDHTTVPTQFFLVRKEGFEPPRGCPHRLLRPARLPVPPLPTWYLPTILIGHWRCQG